MAWPAGNFPIDDDWSFAAVVKTVTVGHGRFALPWFAEMPLITHIAWASLFVTIAGFSFDTLRLSTIALTALGLVGLWILSLRCGLTRTSAAFVTAAFAMSPAVFQLTNSFMTDVPFAVWSIWSALSLAHALRRPTAGAIVLAAACAAASTLLRQPGLLLPAMFVPAFLIVHGLSRRNVMLAALPMCVAAAAYGGFSAWIRLTGREGAIFAGFLSWPANALHETPQAIEAAIRARFLNILFHISWSLLPVALWTTRRPATMRGRAWLLGAVAAAMAAVWFSGRVGPWSVSTIYNLGLGWANVRGESLASMPLPHAPVWVFRLFTMASAASAVLIVTRLLTLAHDAATSWQSVDRARVACAVMFAGVTATMVVAMAAIQFYDRYIFFLIPLIAILCAISARPVAPPSWRPAQVLGAIVFAGYAVFSVAGTHDYFELRRAHWSVVERVVATGRYLPADIDGGLEFVRTVTGQIEFPVAPRVVVTLGDLDGYRRCQTFPFERLMPRRTDRIFLLVAKGEDCPVLK